MTANALLMTNCNCANIFENRPSNYIINAAERILWTRIDAPRIHRILLFSSVNGRKLCFSKKNSDHGEVAETRLTVSRSICQSWESHFIPSKMSAAQSSYLSFVTQQLVTYVGMFNVTAGLLGGLLNLVIFLGLKTFRQNSSAVFLTVMSAMNMGQLFTGQLSRVLITGFGIDWTKASLGFCKFRWYGVQVFGYISLTCMCLATIDQFMATCARVYWQQCNSTKMSRRLCIGVTLFGML